MGNKKNSKKGKKNVINPENPTFVNADEVQEEDEFLDASNELAQLDLTDPFIDVQEIARTQGLLQRPCIGDDNSNFSDTSSMSSKRSYGLIASPGSEQQATPKIQIIDYEIINEDSNSHEGLASGFQELNVSENDFRELGKDMGLTKSEMTRLNSQIRLSSGTPNSSDFLSQIQNDRKNTTPMNIIKQTESAADPPASFTAEGTSGDQASTSQIRSSENTPEGPSTVLGSKVNIAETGNNATSGYKRSWEDSRDPIILPPRPTPQRDQTNSRSVSRFKDPSVVESDGTVFVAYVPESYPEKIISNDEKFKIMNAMSNAYKDGRDAMKRRNISQVEFLATAGLLVMREKNAKGAGWNELLFKQQNWRKILSFNISCVPARDVVASPAFMLTTPRTDLNWKDIVSNIRNSNGKTFSTKDWKLTVTLEDKGPIKVFQKFLFITNGNLNAFMGEKRDIRVRFPPYNPAIIRKMHNGGNNPLTYAINTRAKTDTEVAEERMEKRRRLVEEFDRDFGDDIPEDPMDESESE